MNIKEKGRHPRVRYPWIGAHVNDYIRRNTMGFFDAFFKEQQRTKSEEIYDRALQIFNSPSCKMSLVKRSLPGGAPGRRLRSGERGLRPIWP